MRKFIGILFISLFFLTGCGNAMKTPTKAVEQYLNKYQNLDGEVMAQLDSVISSDVSMSDEQKKDYKDLIINQYKNLSYKIVNENIMNDTAEVEVEIEVLDYASSIGEAKIYYTNHLDEFNDEEKKDTEDEDVDDLSSFIDYKIKSMKDVNNTRKETIVFSLNKVDKEWVVDDLNDLDIEKLHGLYEG